MGPCPAASGLRVCASRAPLRRDWLTALRNKPPRLNIALARPPGAKGHPITAARSNWGLQGINLNLLSEDTYFVLCEVQLDSPRPIAHFAQVHLTRHSAIRNEGITRTDAGKSTTGSVRTYTANNPDQPKLSWLELSSASGVCCGRLVTTEVSAKHAVDAFSASLV